ncbi:MAG: DUF2804 domain-containing protein [Treponema sp.]|nr:DUF2804 domain-containing protein [Treponema sp.]
MPQIEINSPVDLLDDKGQPQNFGWSKQDYYFFDPALSYAPRHAITESDRYIVFSPTHMFVFEVRDDGWLGHMSISVISLKDKNRSTQIYKSIMPLGVYGMPSTSTEGSIRWRKNKTHLDFICMEGGARIIKVDVPKFGRHKSLRGALVLNEIENSQSLVACQPWRNEKNAFRYLRCSPWFIAEGVIQFSSSEIFFSRGNAWGILDWTRSVRPRADIRNWAAACGMSDSRLISFCIGYSQADFSLGTENGFFVDGKINKLDQVTFHIPLSDWLSPWRFTSNDKKLEMMFNPHQERIEKRRLLFHNSTRRQVFGFFSGKIELDDGSVIEFYNLTGFAEQSKMHF